MNADRNLLCGMLALQLNFINRQQLVAAFDHWLVDKSQTLGQVLVGQGALAGDEQALLDALVVKHLARHGNNPEKSLADLTPDDSAREDLKRLGDAELDATLAFVPAAGAVPDATVISSVGEPSSAGTRFRIIRLHARGGLGAVCVAHDKELDREVAVKEIQSRHAGSAESRSRFLAEAEITGRLEHPGIVPVYGLGTYADGRPFYAMKLIKGDSLKDAIDHFHRKDWSTNYGDAEREVELRKLLGRFIDVCDAVDYAHSRGVLHRDLKPGNIMLGKYGETLVVDWGLAKVVGAEESPRGTSESSSGTDVRGSSVATEIGRVLGTPPYMSPEQAEGRWDDLSPASDVYSLGATLYALLTGQAPFDAAQATDVLQQVRAGDFRPPSELKSVPIALEAICLKAMALSPSDRFRSPRELAEAIEQYRSDVALWKCPERYVPTEKQLGWTFKQKFDEFSEEKIRLETARATHTWSAPRTQRSRRNWFDMAMLAFMFASILLALALLIVIISWRFP
jgi:eukaryotic-like serine/threonine-protein kinase